MRIGIDLGGTKIEAVGLYANGDETKRIRVQTPQGQYTETVTAIAQLVHELENRFEAANSIGICTPGSISPVTGLMQNCNSTCLNGQSLKTDLEQSLNRTISMSNDADCLALSEAIDGAAAHAKTVFGVILGTGVGAGYAVNKALITGPNALTGEWGHNPLPVPVSPDRNCYCGRVNCVETWLSGPGISQTYKNQTGKTASAENIATMNSKEATETIDLFIEQLSASLGTIINAIDPEVIVFGGGLSNIERIYQELPKRITSYIMPDICNTQFVPAKHGCSSGIRGAARL